MDHLFDVYVLRFEVSEERATRALMQVFGLSEASARIFVHSVPRIGKRNVPTPTAERYVRALHAVGAVVECRRSGASPLGDNANKVQHMSLPPPTTSDYPGASRPPHIMQDSLGIMAPLAFSPNMPQIPKAPRVPADLHAIRQRKGPDSLAPHWRATNPAVPDARQGSGPSAATSGGAIAASSPNQQALASMDGAFWSPNPDGLQFSSDPLARLQSPFAAAPDSPAPERTDGVDHAALEDMLSSPRPLSPSPFAPSHPIDDDEPSPWYANATHQLLLACLIIGGMVLALSSGVFDTDLTRRTRAFEQAGIEVGEHEPAQNFLGRSGNEFEGIEPQKLHGLLDGLTRSGARAIWVTNIVRQGKTRLARTLVVELPENPEGRRTIFFQHLRQVEPKVPNARPIQDDGKRFLRLVF